MTKAAEARRAAVEALCSDHLYIHPVSGTQLSLTSSRKAVLEEIEKLRPLGRTDRWTGALDTWKVWVEEADSIVWAILEGATHAGYAAL